MSIINKIANSFLVKNLFAIKNGNATAYITAYSGNPNGQVLSPNPVTGTLVIDATTGDIYKYVSGTEYTLIAGKKSNKIAATAGGGSEVIDAVNITVNQTTVIWNLQANNADTGVYSSTLKALISGDEVDYTEYGILQTGTFDSYVPSFTVVKNGAVIELHFDGDAGNGIVVNREVV